MLFAFCICRSVDAQTPSPVAGVTAASYAVSKVVLGIISYTTWPIPPSPLRLCIVGKPVYANVTLLNGAEIGNMHIQTLYPAIGDAQLGVACDAVYAGPMAEPERAILLGRLTGHPVLSINEGDDSCSDGNMFCLVVHGASVSFAVNLDSIARSGVQVNPQVLLLGRHPWQAP